MDLKVTAEEQAFREEVRAFLATKLPAGIRFTRLAGLETSRNRAEWLHRNHCNRVWTDPARGYCSRPEECGK